VPNLQKLGKITIGENVKEQLTLDLALEREALVQLNAGIATCTAEADNGTRDLIERILVSEEEHVDWLEAQLELIEQVGVQNYLAAQID